MSSGRKRVYVGVMLAGALVVVIDRLVLTPGATEPARAIAETPSLSGPDHSARSSSASLAPAIPELPFPRGLPELAVDAAFPDLFAPPHLRQRDLYGGSPADPSGAVHSQRRTGPQGSGGFIKNHRLHGILENDGLKIAVVDDKWLRVGQSLAGCKLTGISGNEATFACRDGEAVLRILDADAVLNHKVSER